MLFLLNLPEELASSKGVMSGPLLGPGLLVSDEGLGCLASPHGWPLAALQHEQGKSWTRGGAGVP